MIWSPKALEVSRIVTEPSSKFMNAMMRDIDTDSGKMPFFVFLLLLGGCPLLASFVVIVIHELGHLLAGWSMGFRFASIRFGIIQIAQPFRVSLYRSGDTGASGLTHMLPTSTTRIRLRRLIFLLAGSAANLLSAYAVILLGAPAFIFTGWFILLSILVGIGNLVPFRSSNFVSDGKRILTLARSHGQVERSTAILKLADDLKNGVAPKDLCSDTIAIAIAVRDDSRETALAHLLAYWHAYYVGTEAEAAHLLETSLQYSNFLSQGLRESIFCDAGIFQANKRKRADLARAWLTDVPEKPEYSRHLLRVEAAILEAQDDFHGALSKIDEVEAAMLKQPDGPQRATSLRLLRQWRSEVEEKATSQPTTAPQ